MPPVAIETSYHSGDLPQEQSVAEISAPNVDVCVVKETEEDESLTIRLYETSGRITQAILNLNGQSLSITMNPFELKTLKMDGATAVEIDLIERNNVICRNAV
jgi:alpha-mannosidase